LPRGAAAATAAAVDRSTVPGPTSAGASVGPSAGAFAVEGGATGEAPGKVATGESAREGIPSPPERGAVVPGGEPAGSTVAPAGFEDGCVAHHRVKTNTPPPSPAKPSFAARFGEDRGGGKTFMIQPWSNHPRYPYKGQFCSTLGEQQPGAQTMGHVDPSKVDALACSCGGRGSPGWCLRDSCEIV
jgi:hypothetical protein